MEGTNSRVTWWFPKGTMLVVGAGFILGTNGLEECGRPPLRTDWFLWRETELRVF